jgi:adenylosuccinate lyase
MIPRYSRPEMAAIWGEEQKLNIWLEIEILAIEARAHLGELPKSAAKEVRRRAGFSVEEVQAKEEITKHDIAAFVDVVGTRLGDLAQYLHLGMTSSDLLDTTFSIQLLKASDILLKGVDRLLAALKNKALEHKYTPMIGRTHGIHAEPVSFGLVMARFYDEFQRGRERLLSAREEVRVGKLSGAVGDYFHLDPRIEEYVMKKLGLKAAAITSQVISRDRYGFYFQVLALVASSIEHLALQVRHFQRTEVLEAEEFFSPGQKGSSAMPHKRNPVLSENMCGLARIIRSYSIAALEDIPLWHERDISHSSAERVIGPDATVFLDFMLNRMAGVIEKLIVYPKRMQENLWLTRGLAFSEGVMLKLMEKGLARADAYALVQADAMKTWQEKDKKFLDILKADPAIKKQLNNKELEECFDLDRLKAKIDVIFARLFASQKK